MNRNIPNLAIDELTLGQNINWQTRDYYVTKDPVNNLLRYFPLRQNCYMISICTSGSMRVRLNGEEITLEINTLAIFTPSTIIDVIEISKDYRCHLVIFMKSFLIETLNNIYFLERFQFLNNNGLFNLRLDANNISNLLSHIDKIITTQKNKTHPYRHDIVRNLIIILIYETDNILKRHISVNNSGNSYGQEKILSDFQVLLRKKFYMERKVGFYSKELSISTQLLTNIVRKYTGKSAKDHIEEMVLTQAKVFLRSGKYNVSEVATLLYYDNIEEFSRFFKRKTSVTPLKFSRNTHL
ncbi:hypothetical protein B0A69_02805 [Chryseobacterium shigense]|uniref:AraC-type DNA-binding protein n=2 Tax=Chryseobacterium shigense TaxID=297244 RepID=A0A1N7I8B0_9FLAO|nr:hypothetical protein B0A69_02805 [Chryseobacterium shigense]SIS33273.1 AraC-type DNA-binding protein [Chryseobacterium shigense]